MFSTCWEILRTAHRFTFLLRTITTSCGDCSSNRCCNKCCHNQTAPFLLEPVATSQVSCVSFLFRVPHRTRLMLSHSARRWSRYTAKHSCLVWIQPHSCVCVPPSLPLNVVPCPTSLPLYVCVCCESVSRMSCVCNPGSAAVFLLCLKHPVHQRRGARSRGSLLWLVLWSQCALMNSHT